MKVRTLLSVTLGTVLVCGGVVVWALLVIDRMVSEAIHDTNYELVEGSTWLRMKHTDENKAQGELQ